MDPKDRETTSIDDKLRSIQNTALRFSDELLFLNETIKDLNKTLELSSVMERFLQSAIRFSCATGGVVFLYQENRGIIRIKAIELPEDGDFLSLVSEMTEGRKRLPVNERTSLAGLEGGTLEVWVHPLIWNVKAAVILYFQETHCGLTESMDLLMEVGFFSLRNAVTFEFTQKSQQLWQLVMDEIPDFIFLVDEDGIVIKCNMAFAERLSVHPKNIVGKKLQELPFKEEMATCINDVIAHDEDPYTKEVKCNGNIYLVTTKRIVLPNERKATLFVVRDITEIRQLQEQLYHSDKLASLGMLVSGVAHEINNPLTGVMGYTELLLARNEDGSLKETLEKIYHSAERCKKIVENLLAFSRQRPPQKAPVLINELLENTLELRAYWLRSNNIEIQKDFRPVPYIKADPQQLQQVFLNLIINAEDAIMGSGKDDRQLRIRSFYEEQHQRVVVEVEDNGCGIPEDILPRIFDPFFTTKPVGKGTGLGLSVSHGIITEHGGSISVKSVPGEGTVFRIELPVEKTL